jgi:hypothetical protein
MSATYIGASTEFVTETSFEQSKEGLITYTEKKLIAANVAVTPPSLANTKSIGGITLRAVSTNVTSHSGSFTEVTVVYQGGEDTTLQQDTSASTGEEPIESNKYFLQPDPEGGDSIVNLAGTANVIYNDDGSFKGFSKNAKKQLFGVTSFLNPNIVYKRSFNTSVTATATDLSAVGRIVNEDADFPPTTIETITWLCVGIQYIKRGTSYDVTQEFRASDAKGWNEYIYGSPVSPPPTP